MFLFRVDFQASLFLLPYVVQDALASSSEQARSACVGCFRFFRFTF